MKLHTIIFSTRPGRIGPAVGTWFHEKAKAHGAFDCELVDLADFNLPVFDEPRHPRMGQYQHEHTKKWAASVAAADAFAFVIPEYNFFAPPSLVNAIAYLATEWEYKPAVMVSYGGVSGGLRAAQASKPLMTSVGIMPVPQGVGVPMAMQLIKDGVFHSNDLIDDSVKNSLNALEKWTKALMPMRGR